MSVAEPQAGPAAGGPVAGGPAAGGPVAHGPAARPGGGPDGRVPAALLHHGDTEVGGGLVDLAVNVRAGAPPEWLRHRLSEAVRDVAAYPDPAPARTAVAAWHGRSADEVLLTAGAAEAFVLLARALRPRHAVVVHPQFTEPEAALLAAGHPVDRVVLAPPFRLDPALVPESADLVVVGNPTNPTSVLHPAGALRALLRPGRTVVVDEAFMDCVPGETESLARDGRFVVVRSLTKTWGLAGLRVGYVLSAASVVAELAAAQPLWAVSTPALAAVQAVLTPGAQAEVDAWAAGELPGDRALLVATLQEAGFEVAGPAAASFVLARHDRAAELREALRSLGFALRRADTFPGLGPEWVRVAVRDAATTGALAVALAACGAAPAATDAIGSARGGVAAAPAPAWASR